MTSVDDRLRVLVVGGSGGIGRAVGLGAVARGAHVMLAARRGELLEQTVVEANDAAPEGARAVAMPCDVRDEAACRRLVERTLDAFAGLDAVVYAAGFGHLRSLADADSEYWRAVFDVNVVGAAQITRFALPALEQSGGHAVFLSSPTAQRPWPGMVPYSASKAALEKVVDGMRSEHPRVSFTSVIVHPTESDFDTGWDRQAYREKVVEWLSGGYVSPREKMPTADMAGAILDALTSRVEVAAIDVRRRPTAPSKGPSR